MLNTENSLNYRRGNVGKPGGAQGTERRNSRSAQDGEFPGNFSKALDRAARADGKVIEETAKGEKKLSREELLQVISEHREEVLKKLKNGDTGVKIPIGSMSLTEEEWEKLLKSFDDAQEKIQETIQEDIGKDLPEKRPDTIEK